MKPCLTLLLLIFFFSSYSQSDSSNYKQRTLKLTISTLDGKFQKGFLTEIRDSSLVMSLKPFPLGTKNIGENVTAAYSTPDLSYIKIQRKGSVGRGILIGTIGGALIGVASGLISGDDKLYTTQEDPWGVANAFRLTAGEKALGLGILGTFGGGITGGIIGALAHKKFIIAGKKENFDTMKTSVLEKAYRKS